jgi:hypothetical protein
MIETIAGWLSRDVALWGELYSPMLSWIGAAALIIFVVWQTIRLWADVGAARAVCLDIGAPLVQLQEARGVTHQDPLVPHRHTLRSRVPQQANIRDVDDVRMLDRLMDLDPAVSQAWAQYRKTLVLLFPSNMSRGKFRGMPWSDDRCLKSSHNTPLRCMAWRIS